MATFLGTPPDTGLSGPCLQPLPEAASAPPRGTHVATPPASLTCGLQEVPHAGIHWGDAAAQRAGALRAERAGSGGGKRGKDTRRPGHPGGQQRTPGFSRPTSMPSGWLAVLGTGSLTCHIGCQPVHLYLLLPQRVSAVAQAQCRDSISDQHQPCRGRGLRTCPTQSSRPFPPRPALPFTLGMGPVGDAQGGRVGVYAISNHPIEDTAACGQPIAGQEPHDARVAVVELGGDRRGQ